MFIGSKQLCVGAPAFPPSSANDENASCQPASSHTGEPTASFNGSTDEPVSTVPDLTDLTDLDKIRKQLTTKKEKTDYHINFLTTHRTQGTTPRGLTVRLQRSVPDYYGLVLERSTQELQEKVNKQASDLALEHYKALTSTHLHIALQLF